MRERKGRFCNAIQVRLEAPHSARLLEDGEDKPADVVQEEE